MSRLACAYVAVLCLASSQVTFAAELGNSQFADALSSEPAAISDQFTVIRGQSPCADDGCSDSGCSDSSCSDSGCSLSNFLNGGCAAEGCTVEGCDSSCAFATPKVNTSPGCSRTYYGIEASLLKPHTGNINIPGVGSLTPGYDYELASRLFIGHENAEGLGARITWWQFDHPANGGAFATAGVEAMSVDFDITSRAQFCGWDLTTFGGVRYGELQLNLGALGTVLATDFDGFGPTVGLQARRKYSDSLALIANGRAALLFGDTTVSVQGLGAGDAEDHYLQTMEASIGVEHTKSLGSGVLTTRAMLEAQTWESGSILGLINTDIGFVGPTLSVGFAR